MKQKTCQRSSNSGSGLKSTEGDWSTELSPSGLTKNSYSS